MVRSKITAFTPDELREIIAELYGPYGGQRRLADDLGMGIVTINRWCRGTAPIDQQKANHVLLLLKNHREREKAKPTDIEELF